MESEAYFGRGEVAVFTFIVGAILVANDEELKNFKKEALRRCVWRRQEMYFISLWLSPPTQF